ncbi:MAG: 3-deoxy-7-phosphoheptulonate synthase [Polyangiaceae bacterium]|nr:3-deoxy-7-phosphoheptulonate synthase [Polyangiaceae bacterium]
MSIDPRATFAFQGGVGSYTEIAVRGLVADGGATTGHATYDDVVAAVVAGRARYGVLPVEYTVVGTLEDAYDLLASGEIVPVAELIGKVEHCLVAPPGATTATLREVLSHPVALAQCEGLFARLPAARAIAFSDPALAAREVAERADASRGAIASAAAAEAFGLVVLERDVADERASYTRYLVVERAPRPGTPPSPRADAPQKTLLSLSPDARSGGIAAVLGELSHAGVRVEKLVSRPRPGVSWEDVLYVELDGAAEDAVVADALSRVRGKCSWFRVLGSFLRAARPTPPPSAPPPPPAREVREVPPLPPAARNYPRAARQARSEPTIVRVGDVELGGDTFVVAAGPCSVETVEQIEGVAEHVRRAGARLLRGGVFKPRTNPYSFQGLGYEGLRIMKAAGERAGLPIVTEVMAPSQVDPVAAVADMLQIGARNMQNFDLLRAVGRTHRPVLLKRGLAGTIDELLAAAEYILSEGNQAVVLCERGIRTFETATRNTLDLSAVPVLRERTHLPVVVDPSHGVGVRRWIRPLCRAAKVVGAHGILIEVHPDPPRSVSDAEQALSYDDFSRIMGDLRELGGDAVYPA